MTDLFERDYVRWAEEQARALREGRFDALDREHLAEEIEYMGGSLRREVVSRLAVIIHHLLKQRVQPDLDGRSWRSTLGIQRGHLARRLAEAPSLRGYLDEAFEIALPTAIRYAELETGISADRFEIELVTLDDALGEDFDERPQRRGGGRVREPDAEWRATPASGAPAGGGA
jgi:hypothetical protein